jgi:hypothetical protein
MLFTNMSKKMNPLALACCAVLAWGAAGAASADTLEAKNLKIPKTGQAPRLADFIHGVPDYAGVPITDFKQREPGDGTPASRATTAYLSYDDTHLYAVFVAKEDPALVRARMGKRKDLFGDDVTILELDTFHDKQRSFMFWVNPYGVQLDAKRTEGQEADFDFETQWQSDGQITADGYVTMIAIPFKSLRFKSGPSQTWGVAVGRYIGRLGELSFWPLMTHRIGSFVPQMANMEIGQDLAAGRNAQLIPYAYVGNSKRFADDAAGTPVWQRTRKTQIGVDGKFVLGDAAALDVTIKPDFSQVESDELQVLVDKRYEVLFPEKRPFFLENAAVFQTPQPLLFSRRIADPTLGARLTGRKDNWSYGALAINDRALGRDLPATDARFEKDARITVGRLQNDFGKGSNIGVLMTDRRFAGQSDSVLGLDMHYKLDENWAVNTQLAGSESKGEAGVSRGGALKYVELAHKGRSLNYSGKLLDISAAFDTALAFLPRTDVRQFAQTAGYVWNLDDHAWLANIGPQLSTVVTRDHQGRTQDWSADAAVVALQLNNSSWELHAKTGHELFNGVDFSKQGVAAAVFSDSIAWLAFEGNAELTEAINYGPAKGAQAQLGNARSISGKLTLKPHHQWRIQESFFWSDLQAKATPAQASAAIYRNLLARTKFSYQHNRFLGARLIFDYNLLSTNAQLSGLKPGKQLNTDFQLSYVLNPGTTLYAGVSDRQENLALIGNPGYLRSTDKLDLHTGRGAFVKMSYLFRP